MPFTPYTCTSPDDPAREDDGLFGPGSVTWRIMNSRIMWVAALRALYLQALHPRVVRSRLPFSAADLDAFVAEQRASAELIGIDRAAAPASMAELDAYYEQIRPRLYAGDEARQALRVIMLPPVPAGHRGLKLGMTLVSALAFSTLPGWARGMVRSADRAREPGDGDRRAPGRAADVQPAVAVPRRHAGCPPRRIGR
jgi:uncharacterized protein (DUF2236 family)